MNIVILGRPGAGKGTQSQRIESHFGLRHLSTGELLRAAKQQDNPLGREIAERIDAGNFVSDDLAISLIEPALQHPSPLGYIFDGIPRTVEQARMLTELLERYDSKVDIVLELTVSEAVSTSRLCNRAKVELREDDTLGTIHHRLNVYDAETAPLTRSYQTEQVLVYSIDGEGTPREVFDLIDVRLHGQIAAGRTRTTN